VFACAFTALLGAKYAAHSMKGLKYIKYNNHKYVYPINTIGTKI
jgi:hypothetical protein